MLKFAQHFRFNEVSNQVRAAVSAASSDISLFVLHGGRLWREGELSTISFPGDPLKPVRTPVAIFGSLGVCIYVPASRHWLISYSPVHLN